MLHKTKPGKSRRVLHELLEGSCLWMDRSGSLEEGGPNGGLSA